MTVFRHAPSPRGLSMNAGTNPYHVFLLQDSTAPSDRSPSRSETSADTPRIRSWAGTNAAFPFPGSGNTGGAGDIVTGGNRSASCCRPFLAPPRKENGKKRCHYEFVSREYSTFYQPSVYRCQALFLERSLYMRERGVCAPAAFSSCLCPGQVDLGFL